MERAWWLGVSVFCLLAAAPALAQMALGPEGPSIPPASAAPYSLRDGSAASGYLEEKLSFLAPFYDAQDELGGFQSLYGQFSTEGNPGKKAVLRDLLETLRNPSEAGLERLAARGLRRDSPLAAALERHRRRFEAARASNPGLDTALRTAVLPEAEPAAAAPEPALVSLPEKVLAEASALSRTKRDDLSARPAAEKLGPLYAQAQDLKQMGEAVWRSPRRFDQNEKLLPYVVAFVHRIPPDLRPEYRLYTGRERAVFEAATPKVLAAALNRVGLIVTSLVAERSPLLTPRAVLELKKAFAPHPILAFAKERLDEYFPAPRHVRIVPWFEKNRYRGLDGRLREPMREFGGVSHSIVPDPIYGWRDFFSWGAGPSSLLVLAALAAAALAASFVDPVLGAVVLAALPLKAVWTGVQFRAAVRKARIQRRDALKAEADENFSDWTPPA
jgi:hypothetical protein